MAEQLLAYSKVGRSQRGGFWIFEKCVMCGAVFERKSRPWRDRCPRRTCGRAECVDGWRRERIRRRNMAKGTPGTVAVSACVICDVLFLTWANRKVCGPECYRLLRNVYAREWRAANPERHRAFQRASRSKRGAQK